MFTSMVVHGEQVELGLQDASEKVKVQERFSKPSNLNMDMKILCWLRKGNSIQKH